MKKIFITIICLFTIIYTTMNVDKISDYLALKIIGNNELIINEKNEYSKDNGFLFVNLNNDYVPYSYQDLLNIIFTIINNGWDTFTFYCPAEYNSCINDIEKISEDELTLTHINNYVHPFNSFTMLRTSILETGEVTIKVEHLYTKEQIKAIDDEINKLMNTLVKNNNSMKDNIKVIHDYIINNTKYDESINKNEESKYASNIAYGVLFDHYATCNGYTDTMAIFLTKLGIINYKIGTTKEDFVTSEAGHVWNAVFLDNEWLHLDLTWDDPVTNTGEDVLFHKYFLINNKELKDADNGDIKLEEHNFNPNIYLEFNEKSKSLT